MTTIDPQPQGLTLHDLSPEQPINKPPIENRSGSVIYEVPGSPGKNYENFGTFGAIKSIDEHNDADKFSNAKSPIAKKPPSHTDITETKTEKPLADVAVAPVNAQQVNARILGLLQNCDNILRKSQGLSLKEKEAIAQYEQQQPPLHQTHYADPHTSVSYNYSDSALKPEATGTSLKYSASLIPHSAAVGNIDSEISEIQKNGEYTKRSYDISYDESPMRNDRSPVFQHKEVYPERTVKASNELFPIKESERSSMVSTGPTDLREVNTLKSRISSLEEKLNSLDGYKSTTLVDQVLNTRQPASRTFNGFSADRPRSPYGGNTPNFSATAPNRVREFPSPDQEIPRRAAQSYGQDTGYSREQDNYRPLKVSTGPTGPEDVSQQAVQNIDRLIQNQLLNRHMRQSRASQLPRSQYTSPTKMPFETNPLYKSNVLMRSEEPVSSYNKTGDYDFYRDSNISRPVEREVRSFYPVEREVKSFYPVEREAKSYYPVYTTSQQPTPTKADYSVSETRSPQRYVRPLERSQITSPKPEIPPELQYSNAFDESSPIVLAKPYDIASTFDLRPYDSYKMDPNYKTGPYINRLEDYSNKDYYGQSFSESYKQTASHSTDKDQDNKPKRATPLPGPVSNDVTSPTAELSSDRKMKKLTLKARASEEKDPKDKDLSSAKKTLHTNDFTLDNEPSMFDFNATETFHSDHETSPYKGFRAGDLLPDRDDFPLQQFRAGEIEDSTPQAGNQSGNQSRKFNSGNLLADREDSKKVKFNSGDLLPDQDDVPTPLKGILKAESTLKKSSAPPQSSQDSQGKRANFHAGDLLPDSDSPINREVEIDNRQPAEKEKRSKLPVPVEKEKLSKKVNFNSGDLLPDAEAVDFRAGELLNDVETPINKINANVPDDGRAWLMVHRLESGVFESTDNSFQFEAEMLKSEDPREKVLRSQAPPADIVKHLPKQVPKQMNNSVPLSQYMEDRDGSKAHIWVIDSTENIMHESLLKSSTRMSESMRNAPKARVITHCFEKYGDFSLKP